jgi:uncharacterized RDD family membrane protein YckC
MSDPGPIADVAAPMDAAESVVGYGGFWRRAAASVIDGLLFVPVNFLLEMISGGEVGGAIAGLILMVIYEAGMTASRTQATLGKMALGLKVVDADGQRLTLGRSIGRWFAKIPSGLLLCAGFIMVAFTERKRGLHDMICATLVLRVDRRPQGALPLPNA